MATRTRCPSCSASATAKSWWTRAPTPITPNLRGGATSAARWRTTPWASTAKTSRCRPEISCGRDHAQARCIEFEAGTGAAALRRRTLRIPAARGSGGAPARDRSTTRAGSSSKSPTCCVVTASIACAAPGISRKTARWNARGSGLKITSGRTQLFFEPRRRRSTASKCIAAAEPEQGGWVSRSFGRKQPSTTAHWNSRISGVTVLRTRITYTRARAIGI